MQAEVIFLWAMLLIMDPSADRGKAISGSPQANVFDKNAFREN